MKRGALLAAVLLCGVGWVSTASAGHGPNTVLSVDDGEHFYDSTGDCVGNTNNHEQGEALRHWHVGLPFVPAQAEVSGGFGCGDDWRPQTWEVTIEEGHIASVEGEITYTWDQNVPGGGFNDVHLHIWDEEDDLVYSTFDEHGPQPVDPTAPMPPLSHTIDTSLAPGTYTIEEDIFSGEHTTWLTNLEIVEDHEVTTQG